MGERRAEGLKRQLRTEEAARESLKRQAAELGVRFTDGGAGSVGDRASPPRVIPA